MSITYIDRNLEAGNEHDHPAMEINKEHPCYKIVRSLVDKKSVFHWDKQQAVAMYKYYVEGWHSTDFADEFGNRLYESDFKEAIKKSHYQILSGKKLVPSKETIGDMWAAIEMERKMLAANGESEDENN